MSYIKRFVLIATTLTAMLILVACGDEKKDDTPPTNTAVSIENPATLVGNYEIASFSQSNGTLDLTTDNLSGIQSFKGQATIEIIEGKVIIKSKIQLESVDMESPLVVMMAGDQTFQLTNYKDNYSLAPDATYNPDTQSISADNITIKQDGDIVVVSIKILHVIPVEVTVKLKKVNDAVIGLSADRYWKNENVITKDGVIEPKALTSYYRITGTATESDAMTAEAGFRGNMSIVVNMDNGISVKIYYKFQDPENAVAEWKGYKYGVATYDIKRAIVVPQLKTIIPAIFQDLGAEVVDGTKMKITFKSPLDNNSKEVTTQTGGIDYELLDHKLPIDTTKKIVFTLEKLYDGTLLGMPSAEQHPIVQNEEYYK